VQQRWNKPRQQIFVRRIKDKPSSSYRDGVVAAEAEFISFSLRAISRQYFTVLRFQSGIGSESKRCGRSDQDEVIAPQMNWLVARPNQHAFALLYPAKNKVVPFVEPKAPLSGGVGSAPQGATWSQKSDEIKKRIHSLGKNIKV
jgi:hypothetical protein